MSVDFPRAWEIARAVPATEHDPRCSFAQTTGAILCDCHVLTRHPEYLDDVLQTCDTPRPLVCAACTKPVERTFDDDWQHVSVNDGLACTYPVLPARAEAEGLR